METEASADTPAVAAAETPNEASPAKVGLYMYLDPNETAPEWSWRNYKYLHIRRPRRKKVKAKLVESEEGTLGAFLDGFYNENRIFASILYLDLV